MMGRSLTVTSLVGSEAQELLSRVKVKLANPPDIPNTKPSFETEAMFELLLCHVPPIDGDNCELSPSQIVGLPVMLTTGLTRKVIVSDG